MRTPTPRPQPPSDARQLAADVHLEKLRDRDPAAAEAFEFRNVQAVRLTRSAIIQGHSGMAAKGSILLIVPPRPPQGFITAADAVRMLKTGAAEPCSIAEAERIAAGQSAE